MLPFLSCVSPASDGEVGAHDGKCGRSCSSCHGNQPEAQGFLGAQGLHGFFSTAQGLAAQGLAAQGLAAAQGFAAQGLAAQGLAAQGFAAHGLVAAQGLASQGLCDALQAVAAGIAMATIPVRTAA